MRVQSIKPVLIVASERGILGTARTSATTIAPTTTPTRPGPSAPGETSRATAQTRKMAKKGPAPSSKLIVLKTPIVRPRTATEMTGLSSYRVAEVAKVTTIMRMGMSTTKRPGARS
jgi:hypothetical protein